MRQLSRDEVHARKVAELGLDPEAVDLTAAEAIAAALRRAASNLCPCAPRTLVREIVRPLRGLVDDLDAITREVTGTLEAVIAHGDLLEHRDVDAQEQRETPGLLYAAPPSFVARETGAIILLGISSERLSALPEELESRVEHVHHVRHLRPVEGEDLELALVELGLVQLSYDRWLKAPRPASAASLVSHANALLDAAPPSRDVPGLVVLDALRPVDYYRGRWTEPRSHSGRFVARRRQAYGADLWCYAELKDGRPERILDLPAPASRWRGCDEAWHLQMALDEGRGRPQRFRTIPGPRGKTIVQLFSPIPMWHVEGGTRLASQAPRRAAFSPTRWRHPKFRKSCASRGSRCGSRRRPRRSRRE